MSRELHNKWREQGEADFKAGKPISEFYRIVAPGWKRHIELYRSSYETGWRSAQNATRQPNRR